MRKIVSYTGIVIVTFLLLNEIGYYWWRRMNPGTHWAHMFDQYNPLVKYPPPPRSEGVLNNQIRTF